MIYDKCPPPIEDAKVCCRTYLEIQTAKLCLSVEIQTTFIESIWKSCQKLGIWSKSIKNIWKCGLKLSKFSGIPILKTTEKVWNSNLLYRGRALFIWKSPIDRNLCWSVTKTIACYRDLVC